MASLFMIPSMQQWIIIHEALGFLHYATAGVLMGLIYKNKKGVRVTFV